MNHTSNKESAPPKEVLSVLVAQHQQFLAFLEKRVGNRALAEDLLQEAFARSVSKQEDLRNDEAAVAWFYRMLRNSVIDYYRRKDARGRALESFSKELEAAEPSEELNAQVCQCVSSLAKTLKPEYAEALQRVDIDGVPVKDFAESAGISASNAGVRLFRAREALRKQVAAACGTCAQHGCWDCHCGGSGC